jgi:autotransporter-associated beta strand protein
LLPGTGTGTANSTPVYATGTVTLTDANYYTGGTLLQSGTLNINGINALGGANYGGLTFNGGTLQYAANFSGNNGSGDLTSIGTAGITLAAGGGTIDVNGNNLTYAGSVGNNGNGALALKSSLPNGVLTLQGANTYAGGVLVTNVTLIASNTSGSATGSGNVTVQNGGILAGTGSLGGSVTVTTGGTLAPGSAPGVLTFNNNLTLAVGATTVVQVQHSPLASNAINVAGTFTAGGTLVVTNAGATTLAAGDSFPVFNAQNYSGGFVSMVLPALSSGLIWNTNYLATSGTLSVATVTQPVFASVSTIPGGVVFQGGAGLAGANFYLLGSTNLATPLTNWTQLYTNQFDNNGNFNFTNLPIPSIPQSFYLLQVP